MSLLSVPFIQEECSVCYGATKLFDSLSAPLMPRLHVSVSEGEVPRPGFRGRKSRLETVRPLDWDLCSSLCKMLGHPKRRGTSILSLS